MKRSRLNPMSKKRRASLPERERVRLAVFERDGGCVLARLVGMRATDDPPVVVPPCFGPMTPHHLLKSSQGGPYTAQNLVTACAHHNEWIESQPDAAWALGLVIRRGDPLPWEAA